MAHILTKIKFLHMIVFNDQFYKICAEQDAIVSTSIKKRNFFEECKEKKH